MRDRSRIEIMAPAGSFEALTGAAQGGADAVYFGIAQLNMRARSSANFSAEDLPLIVKRAHEQDMKAYLTLNTVIYNHELGQMRSIVDSAMEHGVDAIIVSDPAALQYCKAAGARVHLSTQLNISNLESLQFYAPYAEVAVLSRELDLEQVRKISEGIQRLDVRGRGGERFRLELFVHGALCMAVSGKCYLSLHTHNHSANRGDCLQVCRRAYTVTEKDKEFELDIDNEYIMSPRDLKTIHFLNKILDAGVDILKIEGRARSPEYVKTVSACYKEAVEAWFNGEYENDSIRDRIADWDRRLARVFNRGFWDGYYLGQRLGEWSAVYGSEATHRKVYLGKCSNYFDRIGVVELRIETGSLRQGDEILITGATTGALEATVEEIRVDEKPVQEARKGELCSFKVPELVRRSDKIYKLEERS